MHNRGREASEDVIQRRSEWIYSDHLSYTNQSQKQGGPERNGGTQRSRHQGGGRQWGDNRQRWQQQNVNRATGANVTPLGTPARMSPVNDTPVVEEDSRKMQPTAETAKKRKVETETTESKVLHC